MAGFNVRKEMPGVELSRDEFRKRYSERFSDPVFAPLRAEIDRILDGAWDAYSNSPQGAAHAPRRRRLRRSGLRAFGRLDRRQRADQGRRRSASKTRRRRRASC